MKTRETYIARMKLQLDDLDAQMNALDEKAQHAKEMAHDKYVEEMAKLRLQSKAAKSKFDDMMATSEDKWEGMVADMEKVRDAFTHSFHYFKSQL